MSQWLRTWFFFLFFPSYIVASVLSFYHFISLVPPMLTAGLDDLGGLFQPVIL